MPNDEIDPLLLQIQTNAREMRIISKDILDIALRMEQKFDRMEIKLNRILERLEGQSYP